MKFHLIFDWGGFSSTCLFPTVLVGGDARSGWAYLYWLQGRLGTRWSAGPSELSVVRAALTPRRIVLDRRAEQARRRDEVRWSAKERL